MGISSNPAVLCMENNHLSPNLEDYGFPWISVGTELTPDASCTSHSETFPGDTQTSSAPANSRIPYLGEIIPVQPEKKPLLPLEKLWGIFWKCTHLFLSSVTVITITKNQQLSPCKVFVPFARSERKNVFFPYLKEKMIFPNFHALARAQSWELPQTQDSWRSWGARKRYCTESCPGARN